MNDMGNVRLLIGLVIRCNHKICEYSCCIFLGSVHSCSLTCTHSCTFMYMSTGRFLHSPGHNWICKSVRSRQYCLADTIASDMGTCQGVTQLWKFSVKCAIYFLCVRLGCLYWQTCVRYNYITIINYYITDRLCLSHSRLDSRESSVNVKWAIFGPVPWQSAAEANVSNWHACPTKTWKTRAEWSFANENTELFHFNWRILENCTFIR